MDVYKCSVVSEWMGNKGHMEGFASSERICRLVKDREVSKIVAFTLQAGGDPERKNEDDCSKGCGISETKGKTDYMDANSSTREKLKTGNYS